MLKSVRDLARKLAPAAPDLPRVYGAKDRAGRLCVRFSVGALRRDLTPDQARRLAGELLAHADLASSVSPSSAGRGASAPLGSPRKGSGAQSRLHSPLAREVPVAAAAIVQTPRASEGQARPGARSDGGEAAVSEDIAGADAPAESKGP